MPKDVAFARAYYTEALPTGKIDPVTGGTYHKILHGASTSLTSGRSVIPLVSFAADADPSLKHKWTAMNDPVMGGKSYSNVSVGDDMLRFTGKVAIVPFLGAPGFITAATGRGLGPGGQSPLPPESFVDVSPARASPSLRTTSRTAIPATASPSATAMPSTQATTTRTASRQTSIRRSARSAPSRSRSRASPTTGTTPLANRSSRARSTRVLSGRQDAGQHEDHVHLGGGSRGPRAPRGEEHRLASPGLHRRGSAATAPLCHGGARRSTGARHTSALPRHTRAGPRIPYGFTHTGIRSTQRGDLHRAFDTSADVPHTCSRPSESNAT